MKNSLKILSFCAVSALVLTACSANSAPAEMIEVKPKAKNVILFIGDGMGISTITATRIFDGQSKGMDGEENVLSFETFPNVALVKTYNFDAQVADSAGTASAMNTGIKTEIGKINVRPNENDAHCKSDNHQPPTTMADMAKSAGMSVGLVTTTRLTHATPAAVYGHSSSRYFERDSDLSVDAFEKGCTDLASQLIASNLDYVLGGGLRNFTRDKRNDMRDLMGEWAEKSDNHITVSNAQELRALPKSGPKVLGVMSASHLSFEVDRDDSKQPSISEMTTRAIESLSASGNGYYLMVEGGRIDHAHHDTNAYRALTDAQAFANAVQAAMDVTDPAETLILVTADHSHVFTISGYPGRGNPILGLVRWDEEDSYALAEDGNPYTTLGYYNGANVRGSLNKPLTNAITQAPDYHQEVAIKMDSEAHAGEDVALFARGPGADGARGVIDQKEIYNIMVDALGLGTEDE